MISSGSPPEQNQQVFGDRATELPDKGGAEYVSANVLKRATWLLLAYFGARLFFFALNISSFVPPDEVTHVGLCKIYSKVFLLPENSPATYEFGLVTNIPWLYYWMMGKLLALNFLGISDLVFLRVLNIPLAFGTVWYALKLLRLLTDNHLAQLLLVVVITNIPMFSLLSASVSYDNLANLLAAMAIYYEFAFFRNRSGSLLAASLLCQMAGSLTKITFLPLILLLNGLLVLDGAKHLKTLPEAFRLRLAAFPRRAGPQILVLIVAVGLNLQLYAGNYLRFGAPNPGMSQVLTPEAAMQSRLDARGLIFSQYREGKISFMDALVLAGEIKHPGDKADTFYLLMNFEKLKLNPQLWLGPLNYASFWFQTMAASIFGIRAHLGMFKPPVYLLPVYVVMALAFLGFAVRWRPREAGWGPLCLAAVVIGYAASLVYEVNYDAYHTYGDPSLTVYGRYLFIVMSPVCVLLTRYLLCLFRSERIRAVLALATALLFISYDFPWFLMHASAEWYAWLPH